MRKIRSGDGQSNNEIFHSFIDLESEGEENEPSATASFGEVDSSKANNAKLIRARTNNSEPLLHKGNFNYQ